MSDVEKNIGTHKPEFEGEAGKLTPVSHRFSSVQWSDVLTIRNGKNQKAVECPEGEYPICGSGGEMGRASAFITKGDSVIIGRKGNISSPILMREPFWNVDTAFGLEPNEERLTVEYLYYFCERFNFEKLNKAVTIPSLTKADLLKIDMPLPPINLQREFTDRVVLIDNLKVLLENVKQALDDLVKSQFIEMFGTLEEPRSGIELKTIDSICTSIVRGPFGSALKKEYFVPWHPGVYKVYEQKNAIRKQADIGDYYIEEAKFGELGRFECVPGDILMSCSGTMGELYQLPNDAVPGVINQALCKFTLDSKQILAPYFLEIMSQAVGELGAKGSGIQNIASVKYVKAVRIPVPPVELQRQFADLVARVDKLGFDVQQQIEKLETLKQSLMQEYFG